MTSRDFTAQVSDLRLHHGNELNPGDVVRSVSPHFSFNVGLVLHQSESQGGPVIAALDGDHPFTFWRYEPDTSFLRLVASGDLVVRFDPAQPSDQRPHVAGVLTLVQNDVWLCLAASEHGFLRTKHFSLNSWVFSQPRFEEGCFAAYRSWSLGRSSFGGEFAVVASISAP